MLDHKIYMFFGYVNVSINSEIVLNLSYVLDNVSWFFWIFILYSFLTSLMNDFRFLVTFNSNRFPPFAFTINQAHAVVLAKNKKII